MTERSERLAYWCGRLETTVFNLANGVIDRDEAQRVLAEYHAEFPPEPAWGLPLFDAEAVAR
jgi:hypothetical protein